MAYLIDTAPVIRAANYTRSNRDKGDIRVVVIHDMEAPERSTTAEAVARYFARESTKASAHFCIDNDSVVRCVDDKDVAWAAPGNNHDGLQLEIAGYARQTREQWLDDYSRDALNKAARITAEYCKRYGLNVKKLTDEELRAGHSGIIGHVNATRVYRRSTHTDPGPNFPWDWFMSRVRYYHAHLDRRYSMLLYGKRGTPDYDTASAAVHAAGVGVATANLNEASAAADRGDVVIAVGGQAADDLSFTYNAGQVVTKGNKIAAVGKDGLQSFELVARAIRSVV